ncbi:hypothetical protein [Streptomyces sp. XD-27]|uniref:hypothetical protein n=1 Tax=Streptomyces sp. XD-27 TaxID=3062779 RepID=UPI00350E3809
MPAVALFALAGCGSSDGGGADGPSDDTSSAAARDKGPLCVGKASAEGLHVLRGGGYRLPGGGAVQYETAQSDGMTRTAGLRDGASYQDGQKSQTVKPGQRVTLSGHAYTVSQICSYRVVLWPEDAKDRAKAAAAPASMKPVGGKADERLCFTTNPAVRAAAAKAFPPKGGNWSLLNNGGVTRLHTGGSVAVFSADADKKTATISENCTGITVADYEDVTIGDTLEFAGVEFKLTEVTEDGAVRLTRTSA